MPQFLNKLIIILALLPSMAQSDLKESLRDTIVQSGKAAEMVATFIATHMALAMLHEGAHVITAKAALSVGAEMANNNHYVALEPFNYALCPTAHYPTFKNGIINALVNGIAPILGVAGSYGILKGNNIVIEYAKDYNFKRALIDGMKKDFINKDQNRSLQAASLMHMGLQSLVLVPFKIKCFESHGYEILQDLNVVKK